MPNIDLTLSAALELRPRTAAEICDDALDVEQLTDSLDAGQPFTRKTLCEYLGIGESTLSGWIKEGRIPRMAKNAIVLLEAQQLLAHRVRHLEAQLDAAANDLRVTRSGDSYQVCEYREDAEGEIVGRVIADRVATLEDARLLASGRRALRVLKKVEDSGVFDYVHDMSENEGLLDDVMAAEREVEAHELFLTDYSKWQAKFGKRAVQKRVDDFLADLKPKQDPKS